MSETTEKPKRKRTKKTEAEPTQATSAIDRDAEPEPAAPAAPVRELVEQSPPVMEPPTPFAWESPPGFEPIPQDFLLYSAERSQGRALLGILVDEIELPRERSTGRALVLVLLEPVPLVTADGTLVEGKPGQEVLVEVTHFLRRLLRAAKDREQVGEVWLRSVGWMAADSGDRLPLWDLRHGRTFPRSSVKRGGPR